MNQHLLSHSEKNHYHEEGFLIPQLTLEGSEIEELKHAVDRVIDANSGIRPEDLISVHIDRMLNYHTLIHSHCSVDYSYYI